MGGETRESATPQLGPADSGTRNDPEPADEQRTAEPADSEQGTQSDQVEPATRKSSNSRRADRAGLIAGASVLAVCGGFVLYGVLDTGEDDSAPERKIPTAAVTYEVTGEGAADITYLARSASGEAAVAKAASLPWRKTVDVPLGKEPTISIVLTGDGGEARCTLTVRGRHVQSATATGKFGRATCSGALPGTEATEN